MKNTIIILMIVVMCACLLPLEAVAMAPEETTEPTETILPATEPTEGEETNELEITTEDIGQKILDMLTMIEFSILFMIFIHFSEKWFNIMKFANIENRKV